MKSKIKYIVFLCLLSVTLSLNVNAITLKETTTSGDEFDTIEANTTIIGVTKFTPQEVITAAKATKAGADDAKLYLKQNDNDDEDYESPTIYIYYGEIGGWYSLDENNEATYIEDEELINKLSNLNIYYVNNEVKKFTIDVDYEVDTTKLPKGVNYENNKLNTTALLENFTIYNSTSDEIEYELTDQGTSLSAKYMNDPCFDFMKDSWSVIASNIEEDPNFYPLGCTKNVDMGEELGIHKIRIANNTTPEVCSTEGYSQTACGVVLEFIESIKYEEFNAYNTMSNAGGWAEHSVREELNNEIYNSMPNELKNVILNTVTKSGYRESEEISILTTNDKLYLLSSVEVYGSPYYDTITTNITRQLDYYKDLNVTQNNYSAAIKTNKVNDIAWWLRSVISNDSKRISTVGYNVDVGYSGSNIQQGIAPAFRIG